MGGGNLAWADCRSCLAGSSPRGRGKLFRIVRPRQRHGLIPAWAGETSGVHGRNSTIGAHPRVGGGNLAHVQHKHHRHGLIPAWAGETTWRLGATSRGGAHPRVGGGNQQAIAGRQALMGSSPRGRGKRWGGQSDPGRQGLIPAWAGETGSPVEPTKDGGAHPRVGGGNILFLPRLVFEAGSSPRGRGKPRREAADVLPLGLIPAWAGETSRALPLPVAPWAHPRVGGGNKCNCRRKSSPLGSSPRGRGKRRASAGVF